MKIYHLLSILIFLSLLNSGCTKNRYSHIVWLDEIAFGNIINEHGVPRKNQSFEGDTLRIDGTVYNRGLGMRTPADLQIQLEGNHVIFEAVIGIDSEIYDENNNEIIDASKNNDSICEPAVIFSIYADNRLIYQSRPLDKNSRPEKIRLKFKGVSNLRFVAVATESSTKNVNINWPMAHLRFRENINPVSLQIYSYPKTIIHNHVGYRPNSHKTCLIPMEKIDSLYVLDSSSDKIVYRTTIDLLYGDMGRYLSADFSGLNTPGEYYLMSAGKKTGNFVIDENIYKKLALSNLHFLKNQRNNSLLTKSSQWQNSDDEINSENTISSHGSKEWDETIYALNDLNSIAQLLYTLSVFYEYCDNNEIREFIKDEIKHNNQLFLWMQKSEGKLMHESGGNTLYNNDSNYNTANLKIKGDSITDEKSNPDIVTELVYSIAQARNSTLLNQEDKRLAEISLQTSIKFFNQATKHLHKPDAHTLGAALGAASILFTATKNRIYSSLAEGFADDLIALAETSETKPHGFFETSEIDSFRYDGLKYGDTNWPLIGLCIYAKSLPTMKNTEACIETIINYCEGYAVYLAINNAFKLLPYDIYRNNQGGNRSAGNYYYRYFNENNNLANHWMGINSHIASSGAGLIMAYEIIGDTTLIEIAQRQLDWIYGANPFNASTVTGWGHNHPKPFKPTKADHASPLMHGGVMAGIAGDFFDTPALYPGWKQTAGYSMPALANTMLLTILLDNASR